MKFLTKRKDGGGESTVTGYWLVEIKWLFSIVLIRFDGKSREAFHTHAFNCISWVLSGGLLETMLRGRNRTHLPSWLPFVTRRSDFHKVDSVGTSWVLSIRGPWAKRWEEYLPQSDEFLALESGRAIVDRRSSA